MLKIIWIQNNTKEEIKVYESLALQYFYQQDINQCKKYQDRAQRGKVESNTSAPKSVTLYRGFRTSDDQPFMQKKIYYGSVKTK